METTALTMFNATVKFIDDKIAVKPFCEFFGLDFQNQTERIKRDPILNQLYGNFRTVAQDLKQREMFCLTKRGFIRWIDRLNPQNVAENLREKFIQFQLLIDEYLNGSEEEKLMIGQLNAKLQELKAEYGRLGAEVKATQKALFEALNNRYQYSLPFSENTTTTAIT